MTFTSSRKLDVEKILAVYSSNVVKIVRAEFGDVPKNQFDTRSFICVPRLSATILLTPVLNIRRIDEQSPLADWHFMSHQHIGGSERSKPFSCSDI